MFANLKIRSKIIISFLGIGSLSTIIIVGILINSINCNGRQEIASFEQQEMSRIKNNLKDYVNIAWKIAKTNLKEAEDKEHLIKVYGPKLSSIVDMADSIAKSAVKEAAEGRMTIDEAKKYAREEIKKLRYDNGTGYLWITDTTRPIPRTIMHPIVSSLDGKILDNPKFNCALGKKVNLFVAMVDVALARGEGFVDYIWNKPTKDGVTREQPKLSYVRLVKEWNWVIGTGIYLDDARRDAIEQTKADIKKIRYDHGLGYLWINDTTRPVPKMIMHPIIPRLDGTVLDNPKFNCALGKKINLFTAFVDVTEKTGEGFVDYLWPKPSKNGVTKEEPKLSFVKRFPDTDWIIGTGIYLDEVKKQIAAKKENLQKQQRQLLIKLFTVLAAIGLLAIVLLLFMANKIAKPLQKCAAFCQKLGKGDLSERLEVKGNGKVRQDGDEVVAMGAAMNNLCDTLERKASMAETIADGDLTCKVEISSDRDTLGLALKKMVANLRELLGEIKKTANMVATSSAEMSSITNELAAGAEATNTQAATVASAAEEISANAGNVLDTSKRIGENVNNVSSATEEMNNGIQQVGSKAEEGAKTTETALSRTQNAAETIKLLEEKANEISEITTTIGEITDQTKLLALNATIEAARAGEAGKGFAVVAGEVKELARQSAEAAEGISRSIKEIQNNSSEAVSAINEVAGTIEEVNNSSRHISTSVNEQGRLTADIAGQISETNGNIQEITRAVEELTSGINNVSANIQGVSDVARQSGDGVEKISHSASDLAQQAARLDTLTGRFTLQK
jgi:methyl-accepting chemotaxis protein